MAILKCKMCGGNLEVEQDMTVCECEYCGTKQTVPNVDNEKKITLFTRANRLRSANDFDKAYSIYESIVAEFSEEAEAYWGLVLCKYGIEYVDDPATGKKIPTCHRSSFESIMEDSDFEQALENADVAARRVYREEAKQIEEIRKGIIAVSANEAPYDIFICYKETDENGDRTLDSVLAQDLYDALTDKGYRTFFARITLEDKLGQEYEPYIFAALNSARIMLAVGTDYEFYNAVWVKNEWSRFLKLMTKDKNKHLIPCYKGIDAYDMPREFAKLQAQDLGKVGATQDLLRGIAKLMPKKESASAPVRKAETGSSSMVTRGQFALEDGDFAKAAEFFERALDQNPEDGYAYLGKVLASLRLNRPEQIDDKLVKIYENKDFDRAIRFTDGATSKALSEIKERNHKRHLVRLLNNALLNIYKKKKDEYYRAVHFMNWDAVTEEDFLKAAEMFKKLSGNIKADERYEACLQKAQQKREECLAAEQRAVKEAAYKDYKAQIQQTIDAEIEEKTASIHADFLKKLQSLDEEKNRELNVLREKNQNLKDQINALNTQRMSLAEKRNSLGFFKRKEKELLDREIEKLLQEMHNLNEQINKIKFPEEVWKKYRSDSAKLSEEERYQVRAMRGEVQAAHPILSLEEYVANDKGI